jgi:hypothetical protein
MNKDLEVPAVRLSETEHESRIRLSREIGVHCDPVERFAVLTNEVRRLGP